MKAKINFEKLQKYVNDHNEIVCVISFLSTLLFAVFNRVIGAVQGSIWHESISYCKCGRFLHKHTLDGYVLAQKTKRHGKTFQSTKLGFFNLRLLLDNLYI
jgi:hypothetical protein